MQISQGVSNGITDQHLLLKRRKEACDFIMVSRAVLVGCPNLSDGAKLTYIVICDHDWYEPNRGGRKGYVFPTVKRLAQLRAATGRSIQRHLSELVKHGLLKRVPRKGKSNMLYIESPSTNKVVLSIPIVKPTGDLFGRGGVTKMSPQEAEKDKQTKTINADREKVMEERRTTSQGFSPIKALLTPKHLMATHSSNRQWLAEQMVAATGDRCSLGCYLEIASSCPADLIVEALSWLKEARQQGTIRKSRGALLVGIVRRLCGERRLPDPLKPGESTGYAVAGQVILENRPRVVAADRGALTRARSAAGTYRSRPWRNAVHVC